MAGEFRKLIAFVKQEIRKWGEDEGGDSDADGIFWLVLWPL